MTEEALRQALILSDGSLAIFFTRPIAATFVGLAIFLFCLPLLRPLRAGRIGRRGLGKKTAAPARKAAGS